MSDQDTIIIPPVNAPPQEPSKPSHTPSRRSPKRFLLGLGALLLVVVLPVTVFYLSTTSQLTDQRNKAAYGTPATCSTWSGPIALSGLPGSGDYQAQSDIFIENNTKILQAIWRGNQGWTRTVPVSGGSPTWSAASTWSGPIAITSLPGSGDYQAQSDIYIENKTKLLQAIWRGNQGWTRTVPVVNGTPNWSAASTWGGPIAISTLPGTGDMQAQTDRYEDNNNKLKQAIWRGNQGWTRTVPVVNGTPNWSAASTWSGPIAITGLPGSGSYQAQSDMYIENKTKLLQAIWRGNQGWTRTVPVVADVVVFTGCPTPAPVTPTKPVCTSFETMKIDNCGPASAWSATPREDKCKTQDRNVTLKLNATGAEKMAFMEVTADVNTTNCADIAQGFEAEMNYATTKNRTLSAGLGAKKVCVKLTNDAGSTQCGGMIELVEASCVDQTCKDKHGDKYKCMSGKCNSPDKTMREDVNGDGKVNALDYQIVLNNYQKSPIPNSMSDINEDNAVNALDYSRLLAKYGAGQ